MKLSELMTKLQEVHSEHGDLEIVYPCSPNPDYSDVTTPQSRGLEEFYLGFTDQEKTRLTNRPLTPFSDKLVFVIE
jgi:UDP-N-acetylglucosamine 2-epimerase